MSDIARALRIAIQINVGIVDIDTGFVPNKSTLFGGWKVSGIGRKGASDGLTGYLQAKTIHINMALQG